MVSIGLAMLAGAPGALATPASGRVAAGPVSAYPDQIVSPIGPVGVDQSGQPIASGRVQDVEEDPFAPTQLLALADAGIWKSSDTGGHWSRQPQLDIFGQNSLGGASLAFAPTQRGVVLLTSTDDRRVPSNRGVYRSTDGGVDWSQPRGYRPTCVGGGLGFPTAVTFYGTTAYVAAGCVVGVSADAGASWTWSAPDGGGQFGGVTVDSAGNAFTCGNDGVFESTASGWQQVIDFTSSTWTLGTPLITASGPDAPPDEAYSSCRVTAAPGQNEHLFLTARWSQLVVPGMSYPSGVVEVFHPQQGPWQWQDLKGPAHNNGRQVAVETRSIPSPAGAFDLYWNSDDAWYLQPCSLSAGFDCTPGTTNLEGAGVDPPWTALSYPALHADSGHVLFGPTSPHCVVLIADDGGLQRPGAGNCTGTAASWTYSDRGIQALEPYDLALTSIAGGRPATDVYVAAQDNGGYARLSGENGWRQFDGGNDGYHIEATPTTTGGGPFHVYYGDNGEQFSAGRGWARPAPVLALFNPFSNPASVSSGRSWPWNGLESSQQLSQLPDRRLVLAVSPSGSGSGAASAALFASANGSTWTRLSSHTRSSLPGRIGGEPGVGVIAKGTPAAPVMFVLSFGRLYRVDGIFHSVRELLAGQDVGLDAVADARHLLVYSCPLTGCGAGQLRTSSDGGLTWHVLRTIQRLVPYDGYGGFYPPDGGDPHSTATAGQITSVAQSPIDPSVMAVGTRDTGLYDSSDSGRSWERLAFSAPNLWNLRFDRAGRLYAASFGRGVFQVDPAPNRLQLTRVRLRGKPRSIVYRVRAVSYRGHPLQRLQIVFTMTTRAGLIVPLGRQRTDAAGQATVRIRSSVVRAHATLVATWTGASNRELLTQTSLP